MLTWSALLVKSRSLLNDQVGAVYTDAVLLPYLNIALSELQELYELNNIPVISETSAIITVPVGKTAIGFATTPKLPSDLIDIQEVFESLTGQNTWTPLVRKEYLTPQLPGTITPVAMFGVFAWMRQEIRLLQSLQVNDLKIDYIRSLFPELTISNLINNNDILNTDTFITYRVAALAAEFIDENMARSQALNAYGSSGLERALGISVKGKQSISIRRRPFRAAFKRRRMYV